MKPTSLVRYMICSFLLARSQHNTKYSINRDALEKVALPIAIESLQHGEQDVFAQYLKALYEDFDIDRAIELV